MSIDHVSPMCYTHAAQHSVCQININGYINMVRRENYLILYKFCFPQKVTCLPLKPVLGKLNLKRCHYIVVRAKALQSNDYDSNHEFAQMVL